MLLMNLIFWGALVVTGAVIGNHYSRGTCILCGHIIVKLIRTLSNNCLENQFIWHFHFCLVQFNLLFSLVFFFTSQFKAVAGRFGLDQHGHGGECVRKGLEGAAERHLKRSTTPRRARFGANKPTGGSAVVVDWQEKASLDRFLKKKTRWRKKKKQIASALSRPFGSSPSLVFRANASVRSDGATDTKERGK